MDIRESILRSLSRRPEEADLTSESHDAGQALDRLRAEFPDLSTLVAHRKVLDFGCGAGAQSVALVLEEGCTVSGLDTNTATLKQARALAERYRINPQQLVFTESIAPADLGTFDIVISQNSMEHYPDPEAAMRAMRALLRPGGRLLMLFGPPWFAPYGSHMHFFTKVPWVNILFPEDVVMRVRAAYRSDGALRYEEVESGLNRMTLSRFDRIVRETGWDVERRSDRAVTGLSGLRRLPLLRELVTNRVVALLRKPDGPTC